MRTFSVKRTLTAAQFIASSTNDTTILLPSPGAGKAILIENAIIKYNHVANFTNGGNVTLNAGSTALTGTVANTQFATPTKVIRVLGLDAIVANSAISLKSASAFGGGAGSTVEVTIIFKIVNV